MKQHISFFILVLAVLTLNAAPVDVTKAKQAGTHFLQSHGLIKDGDSISLYTSYPDNPSAPRAFYVFNYNNTGFVLVSADDRCTPILGHSSNGIFVTDSLPANMASWLDDYTSSILSGIEANAPSNPETAKQWNLLLLSPGTPASPKSDDYLLTSTWEQGSGYNNYCPVMSNGSRAVVGCIATAMAQIMRYHGYPSRGFGKKSYLHTAYGTLAVNFDTSEYDYTLMPDKIRRSSTAAERDMVSRFCYHCGIVVDMIYEHPGHTTGSGSFTRLVPEGLLYFGYTETSYLTYNSTNDIVVWKQAIRNEIRNLRPILYSGVGDAGGHAFVLDGFNNEDRFHFNWGWGGYADGFYSLNTMQGFTSNQEMVINIKPSGWDGHLTRFHVSPDGNGDGTSWETANSDIRSAVALSTLLYTSRSTPREIWMKEGLYYGDTSAQYAFTLSGAAKILGGFDGTETQIGQRNPDAHPTIIDGLNQHALLNGIGSNYSNPLSFYNIVFQNGYANNSQGPIVNLTRNTNSRSLTIRNCSVQGSDSADLNASNSVLNLTSGIVRCLRAYNNSAPAVCHLDDAVLRQSLLHNNNGDCLVLNSGCRIVNCDILSNKGTGVTFQVSRNSFVNNIIWNNDSSLRLYTPLHDTTLRYSAIESDTAVGDSTCLILDHDNNAPQGPLFIRPILDKGISTLPDDLSWELAPGSPCINAGVRLTESINDGDINGNLRCRQGYIDLGCYESNHPVSINDIQLPTITLLPNPATTYLTVSGLQSPSIEIYDLKGRCLITTPSHLEATSINISSLPAGLYLLKSGNHTAKFIKQ